MNTREDVYRFVVGFSTEHVGAFPTHRAIVKGCDISSTSEVNRRLRQLEKDGRLTRIDGVLVVAGATWLAPGKERVATDHNNLRRS